MSLPDLTGRCAVITGASRGIGAGLAEACAERGMTLGLFSRSAPALGEGDRVLARKVDVTVLFDQERVVELTTIRAGGAPFVERMVIENDRVTYEGVPFAAGDVDLEISCTNGTDTWAPYQVVLKPQGVGGGDRRR